HLELFDVLAEYYRVDPLRWFEGKPGAALPPLPSGQEGTAGENLEATAPPELHESDFIDFTCPYCRNPISFPELEAGKLKQCPNCLESMIVPDRTGQPADRIPFPIRTERLVLRRFQTLDAKDLVDLMADSATLRYLVWNPMSLEDAEEWIAGQSRVSFPHS